MNIGLIIAGGVGARMNSTIPKQFMIVKGKPIIVYTLEAFQRNEQIDAIAVVCLNGWEDILYKYIEKYALTKVKWVTQGGENRNGVIAKWYEFIEKRVRAERYYCYTRCSSSTNNR